MKLELVLPTVIAIVIYVLILGLFGWIFHLKPTAAIFTGSGHEFRTRSGQYSFAAFLIAIFALLHDRAVKFIENLLLIMAGNGTKIYEIHDSIVLAIGVALSFLLLDFLILGIFNKSSK